MPWKENSGYLEDKYKIQKNLPDEISVCSQVHKPAKEMSMSVKKKDSHTYRSSSLKC